MSSPHRYLLLQVRNAEDPMRTQEVACFARALACDAAQIDVHDLLAGAPSQSAVARADALLFGGSGDYSVAATNDPWLDATLVVLKHLIETGKPTFASCWGFQAIARALGGTCVHDPSRAEVGSIELALTEAGRSDPVFGALPDRFIGQAGHYDRVDRLPPGAILLASSERVRNQAFTLTGRPVYCTQFHPELDRRALLERLENYPSYVDRYCGQSLSEFTRRSCRDAPDSDRLLRRFVVQMLDAPTRP
ncbi:MAG: type 1 glutamine amidotransferase [Pirellulales bacterium]|nr:type 1 glutamine amidotransferase [Planctomycetales bacterium]